jgi:uncharacterized protein (DUF58 family)
MTTPGVQLDWQPSAHAKRLLVLTALAVLLGLALGRPAVAALAAVPIAFLCRRTVPSANTATIQVDPAAPTSFEHEPVGLSVRVALQRPVDVVDIAVHPARFVEWRGERCTLCHSATAALAGEVAVHRWGRRDLGTAAVTVVSDAGLRRAALRVDLGELATFPQPSPAPRPVVAPLRGGLAGDHRGRRTGPGAEFAGIRPYGAGDSPARVNWPISLRLQRLHVTQRLTEDAVDVVVVVDTFTDVGPIGKSSLDLSVRGATGLARALLRSHDRVGVVALGGWLRWLRPDTGTRQFYRVAAAMLDVIDRESYVDPDVSRLPPKAVPSGAHVVMFSPLLDHRALPAIEQLRLRGVVVTVVDVLTSRPAARNSADRLTVRLWRLTREATEHALAGLGVLVVAWDGSVPLDALLRPALSGRRLVGRR